MTVARYRNQKHADKLGCAASGYTSLLKAQKTWCAPLFRQKIALDDAGKTPVKFYDETKKRSASEQIAQTEWRDITMDISLPISSVSVNAGNWGCVANPYSILVRPNDLGGAEFSSGEGDSFD